MYPKFSKSVILWFLFLSSMIAAESKVVSNDKNEVANGNGTVVVVNIRDLNKTQYHNQNFRQGNYNYGYDIKPDGPLGQFHHENKAEDGVVYGCYGYVDPLEQPQITYYVSDSWGYRALQQGQSIKVFYPKDHPEGTTEMKGFELKWAQLQFPKQCDSLVETILAANPKPILQAGSSPIASIPATAAPASAPVPRPTLVPTPRPTPSPAAPVSKKNQTPLSVMLTFGPTATLDGITGPANKPNSGYDGQTSETAKPTIRLENSVAPVTKLPAAGSGTGYGGSPGSKDGPSLPSQPIVIGYGEAPENDPVHGNGPSGISGNSDGIKNDRGGSTHQFPSSPASDSYTRQPVSSSPVPTRLGGSGGSSAETEGYNRRTSSSIISTQQPVTVTEYNRAPANANTAASAVPRKEEPFATKIEYRIPTSSPAPPTPTSGSHRVPEITVHITQPNYDDGSRPYPQSGESDDDNYYAGGSNKNIIYPNSNENLSAYGSEESSDRKHNTPQPPSQDYRPPSPTINYIQQTPQFNDPPPQYPSRSSGNSGPRRGDGNSGKQVVPGTRVSGTSSGGAPSTSFGIRTPDGQTYPSPSEQTPIRAVSGSSSFHGTYPSQSPSVTYVEDRQGPSAGGSVVNYGNRRVAPVQGNNQNNQQFPSGNESGGCNGGCNQQEQQSGTSDPQFIDYSQFPGAVVSNVPVIFYPDCRSNAFTRPAVVPFCPSLQPSAQPPSAAVPACSHRQPLTMRFPSDQSNTIYSNNYDLPSTRGAYPNNNFVTAGNRVRAARRVVRRSRTHARPINVTNN